MTIPCSKSAAAARQSPRCRKNLNLHDSPAAPAQRFFNAIEPDSYVRPHRHLDAGKEETLLVVCGRIGVLVFDDDGLVVESAVLAAGTPVFGYHFPLGVWHSIVALEAGSVFLEVKGGPYLPFATGDFADWAPDEGSADVPILATLRARFPF